jgi:hypothetical protein
VLQLNDSLTIEASDVAIVSLPVVQQQKQGVVKTTALVSAHFRVKILIR